jgi:Icc protein
MAFSFVHLSDHHLLEAEGTLRLGFSPAFALRTVLRHVAEHVADRVDFLVTTGDVVEPSSEAAYRTARNLFGIDEGQVMLPGPVHINVEGLVGFPMVILPGNHDDRDLFFRRLYSLEQAPRLMNASFEHKGVQFVCLDWGSESKAVADPKMLELLARSLESGRPSILLMHHQAIRVGSRWLDSFIAEDVDTFWEIVARGNVLAILSGHAHLTYEKIVEGVPVLGIRSTAFPFFLHDDPVLTLVPPHYRLITVDEGLLTSCVFEVPL